MSGGAQAGRRVAVTGLGALSPAGVGVAAYRAWLAGGQAGQGGRIAGFEPGRYIRSAKLLRSMHRTFQLVAAAGVEAMRAAGLPSAESLAAAGIAPERAGIAAALADLSPLTPDLLQALAQAAPEGEAGSPGWARFAELALHQLHPFRRLTLLANMAAAHTSLLYGLQGPSFTFTTGRAAGAQTIAEGYWTIAHGRADLMLCQAAESPEQACTAGPVAEIAGAVVLESWEGAGRRQAPILAELRAEAGAGARPPFSLAEPAAGSPAASLLAALLRLEELAAGDGGVGLGALLGASGAAA
ncbi:MAG TPA: beta-ketoacyl synthase N-terminal-like domain-containing protein [Terriglobales bacterium]|nr:beta-ketoacyl synthase N-terminal-like domain-containing protein [Terriglobales bacterium]